MARDPDNMNFTNLGRIVRMPESAQRVERLGNVLATLRDSRAIAVWDGADMVGVLLTPEEYKTLAGAVAAPQERLQWQALAEANLAGVGAQVAIATIKDLARRLLELTSG